MSVAAESSLAGVNDGQEQTFPVQNVLTVFAAHFHVRRGNEIVWASGHHSVEELNGQGLEWKVLPSGSHLLERDLIFFDVQSSSDVQGVGHLVGIAAFKNRKLLDAEDQRIGASAPGQDDDDQRGARMMAVGAIVDCGDRRTPWTQLAATLPHTCQLEKLVDALSADPSCRTLLQQWFETHQRKSAFVEASSRELTAEGYIYPHDPLLMLPAVSNALGPLLPSILKRLLAAPFRLLIYSPHGSQSFQAASIAFTLAELVHCACQSPSLARASCPVNKRHASVRDPAHGLEVAGIVGLHDIARLEKEAKDPSLARGWIAWTSDRLLMEKPRTYDAVLDLSPMMPSRDTSMIDATVLPRFLRSERTVGKDGKETVELRKQTWTTREFAVYRGLDERASVDATTKRQVRRTLSRKRSHSSVQQTNTSAPTNAADRAVRRASPTYRRPSTSTMLAFITFWLSSLRFLPHRWRVNLRESYGYIPLSIRSDGGVRASIMLLPSSDDEYTSDEEEDGGQTAGSSRFLDVNSSVAASPLLKRRPSLDIDGEGADEDRSGEYDDDPILAAVGAGSFAHRRRHSRVRAGSQKASAQRANDVASLHGTEGGLRSPEESFRSPSPRETVKLHQQQQQEMMREARESIRLALCLFAVWSDWIGELVVSVQDLIQEAAIDIGHAPSDDSSNSTSNAPEAVEEVRETSIDTGAVQDASSPLLQHKTTTNGPSVEKIILSAKALTDVGLSSANATDVHLVHFLASTVTDLPVDVQTSWSILSWFCW